MKIISIGCNCDTRLFIKNNFSCESYPFDWIWSNIDFVIDVFENDYFAFTECEKLNPVWEPNTPHTYIFNNGCSGKEDRICSAVSVHDADGCGPNQYAEIRPFINEKYKRRFKRLYDVLNTTEDVILIRKVLASTQGAVKKSFDSSDKINYLSDILSKKFKAKVTICIVDNEGGFISTDNVRSNIKIFRSFDELLLGIQ